MKHGHVTGAKKERKPRKPWWADAEEATIRRIEAEWQTQGKEPRTAHRTA